MPSYSLVQGGVGLHGVLAQAEEVIGGTVLDGERIVVTIGVHVDRERLATVAGGRVLSRGIEALHHTLMTTGAVERFHT